MKKIRLLKFAGFLLPVIFFITSYAYGQDRTLSGKVTSKNERAPVPGASIIIKGTTSGTTSDFDGNFRLTFNAANPVLVVSYIGYVTQEIPITTQTTLDIVLEEDLQQLKEVVVVGYGTQRRADLTGSISSVSSKDLNVMPVASLDQALQGRAAGVTVIQNAAPGGGAIVRIRGIGSVNNNEPLYVIDGFPAGSLNDINPNDIESIEILKDASAAAIYGSRAANGVIMVTTKRGKSGKTRVTFDSYYGVQNVWRKLDLLNTQQYIEYNTALQQSANLAVPARFSEPGLTDQTDWQNELFRSAAISDNNINISGGSDNARFSVSAGYFRQEGTQIGTDFERYSIRSNTDFKLGKFTFGQSLTLAYSGRNNEALFGGRTQIEHAIKSAPYLVVRDPNNLGGFNGPGFEDEQDAENLVANATLRRNFAERFRFLGSTFAEVEILDGLNYRLTLGADIAANNQFNFSPRFVAGPRQQTPFAEINENRNFFISPLVTNTLNYGKTFGDHNVGATLVFERQTFRVSNTQASGRNLTSNEIRVLQGTTNPAVSGTRTDWALLSYVARGTYSFKDRYLVQATIRRDGSSRFGPEEKWGVFPSVSLGWRVSEEGFMQNIDLISDLKLRGSVGTTGNQNIGDYSFQAALTSGAFYFIGGENRQGITLNQLANRFVRWENTLQKNFGFDLGLANNRIQISAEYFINETRDMLVQSPVAPSLGFDQRPFVNAGSVENRGIEVVAGYRKSVGAFQFTADFNMAFIRNKVLALSANGAPIFSGGFQGDNLTITRIGDPIASFFGWRTDGIFQTQAEIIAANERDGNPNTPFQAAAAPGDIRFVDIDGNGVINNDDRSIIGNPFPDFTYGFNLGASYKNFDLSLFLQGVSGNQVYNGNRYWTEGMLRVFNAGTAVLNRWTGPGTSETIPRAIAGDPNRNSRASDRFLEDGSYMRFKNVSLGYSLPPNVLANFAKGAIGSVRFYMTAQNLFTITNYTGFDPEISAGVGRNTTLELGIDRGEYPQPRVFLGGVQIGF